MIYSNFTGRVAKKAKVIDGVNGQFLSMDMAVNDYSNAATDSNVPDVPTDTPKEKKDDLPF
jgi:hypothetical protein